MLNAFSNVQYYAQNYAGMIGWYLQAWIYVNKFIVKDLQVREK